MHDGTLVGCDRVYAAPQHGLKVFDRRLAVLVVDRNAFKDHLGLNALQQPQDIAGGFALGQLGQVSPLLLNLERKREI